MEIRQARHEKALFYALPPKRDLFITLIWQFRYFFILVEFFRLRLRGRFPLVFANTSCETFPPSSHLLFPPLPPKKRRRKKKNDPFSRKKRRTRSLPCDLVKKGRGGGLENKSMEFDNSGKLSLFNIQKNHPNITYIFKLCLGKNNACRRISPGPKRGGAKWV